MADLPRQIIPVTSRSTVIAVQAAQNSEPFTVVEPCGGKNV